MYFDSMSSFWAMGGYGLYVWLSFGVAALSLVALWLDARLTQKALFKEVRVEQSRQQRIKAARVDSENTEGQA